MKKLRKALQMHESSPFDVELSNKQDIELQQLVSAIDQNWHQTWRQSFKRQRTVEKAVGTHFASVGRRD